MAVTLTEAAAFYEANDPKGEYVLVLDGLDSKKFP